MNAQAEPGAAGVVFATSRLSLPATEIISRSRGLRVESAPSLDDIGRRLREQQPRSVVIVSLRQDTSADTVLRLADLVARHCPQVALSFLLGDDPAHLERLASRLARPATNEPTAGRQLMVNALGLTLEASRLQSVRRGVTSGSAITALLQDETELLIFASHANGFDLDGAGASLCRRATAAAFAGELRVLPCYNGAPCGRVAFGNIEANLDAIRARRAIVATCWGVHLADRLYVSEATLGASFLDNPHIESVLTTVRVANFDAQDLALAYFLANGGLPFGRLANEWNRFRLWRGKQADIVCFSDPDSRLSQTLRDIEREPTECDGGYHIDIPAGSRDVVLRLPDEAVMRGCVVVEEGERSVMSAVLSVDGRMFVSLTSTEQHRLALTFHTPESLHEQELASQLNDDLEFLDIYSTLLRPATRDFPAAQLLTDCRSLAKEFVTRWPRADAAVGAVLSRSRLDQELVMARSSMDVVADAAMTITCDLLERRGALAAGEFWKPAFKLESERPLDDACPYCAQLAEEQTLVSKVGRLTRQVGCCQGCGPLYDGNPDVARWIDAPQPLARGVPNTLAITVTNPYSVAMTARARVVIEPYFSPNPCRSDAAAAEIPPRAVHTLQLTLVPAADLYEGTFYIGACVTIGAAICFLRRPVQIAVR